MHKLIQLSSVRKVACIKGLKLIGAVFITLLLVAASCSEGSPDFSLSVSASSLELEQGSSGNLTVEVTGEAPDPVTLDTNNLPTGVSATFGANPTLTNSILTLTTDLGASPGRYTLSVTGTAAATQKTVTFTLVVKAATEPDFGLTVTPASLVVAQGTSDTVEVTIETAGGFSDSVNLSLTGDLSGVTASFSQTPVKDAATLTLTVSEAAALGLRNLTLTGTTADITKTSTLQLTVESPFGGDKLEAILAAETPPKEPLQLGDHLLVEFIGKGRLVNGVPEEPDFSAFATAPGGADQDTDYDTLSFNVFNPATLNEFKVSFGQPLLEAVHAFQVEQKLTSATDSLDNPDAHEQFIPIPTIETQARSDGNDNRAILNSTTSWPWRTIAQLGGGCTGTLVGPRHVITAAHCINKFGTDEFYTVTVRPGRNGLGTGSDNVPFGSSTISNPLPAGQSGWYWTPSAWRNPDGKDTRQYDWGLIIIPDRLGDQTGWMGYVARPGDDLEQIKHYNRGYPDCSSSRPDTPDDCQTSKLYGNVFPCVLGTFINKGPDGWNRNVSHNCDTSAGHSGSAVYHYFQDANLGNAWVPVVSMIHTWSACDRVIGGELVVCDSSDDHPSVSARLTPSRIALISYFRNAWP